MKLVIKCRVSFQKILVEEEPVVDVEDEEVVKVEDEAAVKAEDEETVEIEDEAAAKVEDEEAVEVEDRAAGKVQDEEVIKVEDELVVKVGDKLQQSQRICGYGILKSIILLGPLYLTLWVTYLGQKVKLLGVRSQLECFLLFLSSIYDEILTCMQIK